MKQQKTISLDAEIVEALGAEDNGSKLINDLLIEHFRGASSYKKQELIKKSKELKEFMTEKETELREMLIQIEKLTLEEKRLDELFKDIPKEIINDFHIFSNMTEEILENRINQIYSVDYPSMNYNKIREAFKEYFKNRKE